MRSSFLNKFALFALCLGMFMCLDLNAQQTYAYKEPDASFRGAIDLYSKAKYGAAKKEFTRVLGKLERDDDYMRSESDYYIALCDAKLFHNNAISGLLKFIDDYPLSNRINYVYFELANLEYFDKKYSQAYKYFKFVSYDILSEEEKIVYNFKLAYSAFMMGNDEDAKFYFALLMKEENKYKVVATYYYAYILYTEGKYQTALNSFKSIEDDGNFSKIIPFYVLQIYHLQSKTAETIKLGNELLGKAKPKRAAEIARVLGEAYYAEGNNSKALTFMRNYYDNSSIRPDNDSRYILGYCYFNLNNYDSAAYFFQSMDDLDEKTTLAQSALYHLAYCYIEMGKKDYAMNAFKDAANMGLNRSIEEDAMYNYLKLLHELSIAPYKEATRSFEVFLERYPNSIYKDRVQTYLFEAYITTKNYKLALESIDKIDLKRVEIYEAWQKLNFNRGVELFYQHQYDSAIAHFARTSANAYSEDLAARANFWQGEAYFKKRDHISALVYYERFINNPLHKNTVENALGYLSLGYAYMENIRYKDAERCFESYLLQENISKEHRKNANIRLGDCRFMLQDFKGAIMAYDRAIESKIQPLDYTYLQKVLCLGAIAEYTKKISILRLLLENYSSSAYMSEVLNELGSTYLLIENNERAIFYYNKLQMDFPKTILARKASLRLGMLYFNVGRTDEALENFKNVVENYPSTQEANQALVSIRNLYVSTNKVDEFFSYAKSITDIDIEESEQDSLTYMAAENKYIEGDCNTAIDAFQKYIERFENAYFKLEAWNYIAQCAKVLGRNDLVLQAYSNIADLPESKYTDEAVMIAAEMYYAKADYEKSLKYFTKMGSSNKLANTLYSKVGIMRSYYHLKDYQRAISSGMQLQKEDNITDEVKQEANIIVARSAKMIGDKELALHQYKNLLNSKNSDYMAEASYYIMEDLFFEKKMEEAEKMIFDYISNAPANDYYLAKFYILWADIYASRKNYLQAEQTLQSIIDNYEGEDLKELARQKKELIKQEEKREAEIEKAIREMKYEDVDEEEIILPGM